MRLSVPTNMMEFFRKSEGNGTPKEAYIILMLWQMNLENLI